MPKWRTQLAAVAAATVLVVGVPAVAASPGDDGPARTLNALGGTSAEDGLRVTYGSGQIEVVLEGEQQLASEGLQPGARLAAGNHFALAVGGTVISDVLANAGAANSLAWETISTFQSYGTIFSTFTPPEALSGYSLFVTVSYTRPGDRVSIRARVGVPEGATEAVRLYWVGQPTLLGGTGYATPELGVAGVFGPRPTDPVSYRTVSAEKGLGEPFQYLVGAATCPYLAVVEGCPSGSGLVAANADLPNLVTEVVDGLVAIAVEYGPLLSGRTDVGFELAFRTVAVPPNAPPPPTEPPTTEPPPNGSTTTTTTVPGPPTTAPPTTAPPTTGPPTSTPPTTAPPTTAPPTSAPPTATTLPLPTTSTTRPAGTTTTRPGTTTTTRPGTTTTTRPGTTTTTRPGTTTTTARPGPPSGTTTTRPR